VSTEHQTIPLPYRTIVDDAAIFPPGDTPLPEALSRHREHRKAPYAGLVGGFVVSDTVLSELSSLLREDGDEPLPTIVVVRGGVGAVEPAVRWVGGDDRQRLAGLEVALRDEDDLVHNARRVVAMVDQLRAAGDLDVDTPVHVEPPPLAGRPPSAGWLGALDELAALELRLKFRTGGVTADAFPSAGDLAACLAASLDRELPFKCTAGLHNALRHTEAGTGFEHHGFLNVLLATRASFDGATTTEVADLLEDRDADSVVGQVREQGEDALGRARRWFTSFGSCSVHDPLHDLTELELLPDLA
jgi:hypothetical protein